MKLRTRRERKTVDLLKRVGIGIFVLIFVASVVGVAFVTLTAR